MVQGWEEAKQRGPRCEKDFCWDNFLSANTLQVRPTDALREILFFFFFLALTVKAAEINHGLALYICTLHFAAKCFCCNIYFF